MIKTDRILKFMPYS